MAIKQVCLWWVRFPVPFNLNSHSPGGGGMQVFECEHVCCVCLQAACAVCMCVRETRLQTPNPLSFAFLLIHSCG